MFDLIFKLAALSEVVTVVISKKADIIHLSITSNGIGETKFKPLLVSGTETQLLEELPTITNHLKAFQGVVNNIKHAADVAKLDKETKDAKKAETAKAKTDGKTTKAAPIKPASASLFDGPKSEEKTDEVDPDEEEPEEDELLDEPETKSEELVTAIPFVETPAAKPVVEKPKVEPVKPTEEEEIF